MRIIVTGSSGFIGYYLCKKLLSEGHSVIGIDNLNNDYDVLIKENRTNELKQIGNFDFIKLDIVNDAFTSILKGQKVDYLVHLAAKDMYYQFPNVIKYTPYLTTNVTGTSNMFELAETLKVKKFIYASTFSVYGETKTGVLNEKRTLPQPISPHGASKMAAEEVIHFLNNFYKLPSVILRIGSVYGPSMRPQTVIPLIIDRLHRGKSIDIYNGDVSRDYLYVEDVVNYIISCFDKRIKFQTFNIASGKSIKISELSFKIGEIMGIKESDIKLTRHKKSFEHVMQNHFTISTARADKSLRYKPQISMDEGLSKTVSWYLNNEAILKKSTHSEA